MITKTSTTTPSAAEQLTLLPNDSVTPRFRLSRETRERGLRHVAEIRRMLAERSATFDTSPSQPSRAA
jgi:hypothetical protein